MGTVEDLGVQTRLVQLQGDVRERDMRIDALTEELRVAKGQNRAKEQSIAGLGLDLDDARRRVAVLETQKHKTEQELKVRPEPCTGPHQPTLSVAAPTPPPDPHSRVAPPGVVGAQCGRPIATDGHPTDGAAPRSR
eukprot:gene2565-3282_t